MNSATDSNLLSVRQQRRNSFVFLLTNSLTYLVAPVFYVGVLHAAILNSMAASDTVANLPEAVYLWVTPVPVLIAWLWPSPGLLRPMLAASMILMGAAGLLVSILFFVAPESWLIAAIVAHSAIIGICNGVRQMCSWELIGRGLSPEWRGWTLGLTFGLGPIFAVAGSCASQLILSGSFLDLIQITPLSAPWSYVVLFGATCPVMWLGAATVGLVDVPAASTTDEGMQLAKVVSGLKQFFCERILVIAAIAFLLTYGGTTIINNLSLYTRDAIGESPEQYAGLQLALRFGFKCLAGFTLGWLVTRINAKASLQVTTATCLLSVCWALVVPGKWYLVSFGLLGAGELFYVYYMNYLVESSPTDRIQENTAYTNLITVMIAVMPLLFGMVSDSYGIRASFVVSAIIFITALLIVGFGLPRRPSMSVEADLSHPQVDS